MLELEQGSVGKGVALAMEALAVGVLIGLGAVFLAAGVAKLIDRADFERHLPAFGVRWPGVARGLSYGLPAVECLLGLMLIAGLLVNVAAGVAAGFLLAFTVVVTAALVRRAPVSCGCFGNIGQGKVNGKTLGRNVFLFCVALLSLSVPLPGAIQPAVAPVTLGLTLSMAILLLAQFLGLRPYYLPIPVSPREGGVRWSYVDPSVRFRPSGLL